MTKKEKKKIINYLLVIVAVSVIISIFGSKVNTEWLRLIIGKTPVLAPVLFVLLLSTNQIIAPLSGTPIFLMGYVMFGEWVVIYNYLSYLIAVVVNFSISRKWGREWVIKLIGKDDMYKIDSFTKVYGVNSLIFLRIFQSHLSDFISYAYGLTNIKFKWYLIISICAPVPSLLMWYFFIFPRVGNITDFGIWFLITLVPLFVISWFYWKYITRKE